MSRTAIQILNDELQEEQARLNKIEADNADAIAAGERAQRAVAAQKRVVTDICEALDVLVERDKAQQVEVIS